MLVTFCVKVSVDKTNRNVSLMNATDNYNELINRGTRLEPWVTLAMTWPSSIVFRVLSAGRETQYVAIASQPVDYVWRSLHSVVSVFDGFPFRMLTYAEAVLAVPSATVRLSTVHVRPFLNPLVLSNVLLLLQAFRPTFSCQFVIMPHHPFVTLSSTSIQLY